MNNPLIANAWPIALVAALGFVAVYLLLPRPRAVARRWGVVAAGLALLVAGALVVRAARLTPEVVLFYAFAGIALLAGGLQVTQSNPARAALSFALVVLSTCGLFLLQAAPFLMAATTIIYAGAIIVTFLFVIMLAQQEGLSDADQRSREPLLASLTGFVLLGALLYVLHANYGTDDIDRVIGLAREAAARPSLDEMVQVVGTTESPEKEGYFYDLKKAIDRGGQSDVARSLREQVVDVEAEWVRVRRDKDAEGARALLKELEQVGLRARASYGALQPSPGAPLSDYSGPPPSAALFRPQGKDGKAAAPALRRGPDDRPALPHENTAYLGRALFTDYLLAVELGGTLLLVATVGAIAIAGRRGETQP
jgi:NADH:ubiquinone oxidoreductase subunit 6 (subunit J)